MAQNRNKNNEREGMSVEEAGRKGGQSTSASHGREFYEEIGSKGGKSAQQSGRSHELTTEERSRGGQQSGGNFANRSSQEMSEIGRKREQDEEK